MSKLNLYEPTTEAEVLEGYGLIKDLYAGYFRDDLNPAAYYEELSAAMHDPSFYAIFAKKEDLVVGVIMFRVIPFVFSGKALWMHSIIVHQEHRREGVGSELIRACQKKGRDLGLNRMYFNSASADLNPDYAGTDTFHAKNGSTKIGTFFVNEFN